MPAFALQDDSKLFTPLGEEFEGISFTRFPITQGAAYVEVRVVRVGRTMPVVGFGVMEEKEGKTILVRLAVIEGRTARKLVPRRQRGLKGLVRWLRTSRGGPRSFQSWSGRTPARKRRRRVGSMRPEILKLVHIGSSSRLIIYFYYFFLLFLLLLLMSYVCDSMFGALYALICQAFMTYEDGPAQDSEDSDLFAGQEESEEEEEPPVPEEEEENAAKKKKGLGRRPCSSRKATSKFFFFFFFFYVENTRFSHVFNTFSLRI